MNIKKLIARFPIQASLKEEAWMRLTLLFAACLTFFSCTTEESEDVNDINKQTVVVFMPWSGSRSGEGLYSYFRQNLDSIESTIKKTSSMSGRVVVFLSTSADSSRLYEITYENKTIDHKMIKRYGGNLYTTAEGIAEILNDVQGSAFALNYAMIIGCHGTGWTFKEDWENYPYRSKGLPFATPPATAKGTNGEGVAYPTTRFYGSVQDDGYQTNITTLADGIRGAGMKMQYILFDDCYMANVETAYELKDVTNHLIASTSEVLALGMPYHTMWASLASATPAYANAVSAFYAFYSKYQYPYGTLSAIDCRKLDRLAEEMKKINGSNTFDSSLTDSLQVLDGFDTPIFYDLGDYVARLCKNTDALNDFNSLLAQAVKSSAHTDSIISNLYPLGDVKFIGIKRFSGMTISDPSRNSVAMKGREKTAWWKATH